MEEVAFVNDVQACLRDLECSTSNRFDEGSSEVTLRCPGSGPMEVLHLADSTVSM